MVLLVNEVGVNIDMTGYVHIGGEIFTCEKGVIAQRK